MSDKLLSAELKAVGDALHNVRLKLCRLSAQVALPAEIWSDVSTVLTAGLDVAEALQRLASNEPKPRTPTHLDERR